MTEADVTVVVPVRNEAAALPDLLRTLVSQTFAVPRMVIVDAGSTDNTINVAKELAEVYQNLDLIDAGPAGPGQARNIGVEAVNSTWVLLIDAGTQFDENLVKQFLSASRNDPAAAVILGSRRCQADVRWRAAATITMFPPRDFVEDRWARQSTGVPCLLKKQSWNEVGGMPDWRAGEDKEFLRRLQLAGVVISYAPAAEVTWDIAASRRRLFLKWRTYEYHAAVHGFSWHWPAVAYNLAGAVLVIPTVSVFGWVGILMVFVPHLARTAVRYGRHRWRGDEEVPGGVLVFFQALLTSVLVDFAVLWGYVCYRLGREPREW